MPLPLFKPPDTLLSTTSSCVVQSPSSNHWASPTHSPMPPCHTHRRVLAISMTFAVHTAMPSFPLTASAPYPELIVVPEGHHCVHARALLSGVCAPSHTCFHAELSLHRSTPITTLEGTTIATGSTTTIELQPDVKPHSNSLLPTLVFSLSSRDSFCTTCHIPPVSRW